jgi:hypothetical protein
MLVHVSGVEHAEWSHRSMNLRHMDSMTEALSYLHSDRFEFNSICLLIEVIIKSMLCILLNRMLLNLDNNISAEFFSGDFRIFIHTLVACKTKPNSVSI